MARFFPVWTLACFWILVFAHCSWSKKVMVSVSIVPQKYLVDKISGDMVQVQVMVPPGSNPAIYEPKPSQLAGLGRSKLYLAMGVPFEQAWLRRFAALNRSLLIVRCEQGIARRNIAWSDLLGQKKPGREEQIKDPHVWLSPPLMRIVAANILAALSQADPAHREVFRHNFYGLAREIAQVDQEISSLFASKTVARTFLTFHPAWGYFAQAYGLQQMAVEVQGREPGPRSLQQILNRSRSLGIKTIFVEPEFSQKCARLLARELGVQVVPVSPLAYDWPRNMLYLAKVLAGQPMVVRPAARSQGGQE